MKDVYTVREVSERMSIAEQTVRKLVRSGEIPSFRPSHRRVVIPIVSFEQWLKEKAAKQ